MRGRLLGLAGLLLAAGPSPAATPESSFVQPSLSLLGVSEHTSGAADAAGDPFDRELGVDVGLGLDARHHVPGGWLDWSAFGLVHDPFVESSRGLFLAGRARGSSRLGARWRLRLDDSARYQRRDTATLSDFQRNELSLGLEHLPSSGLTLGLRLSDRRRAVPDDPAQSFNRQSMLVNATWGRPRALWRVELGPQHFDTDAATGWRAIGTLEWAARLGPWTAGLRGTWIEPFEDTATGAHEGVSLSVPTSAPLPPMFPPDRTTSPDATSTPAPVAPPTREGLLGPSLVVDPLEGDETDWDFGRRKQEIVGVFSRSIGTRLTLTAELRAEIERGPDLLAEPASFVDVRRERYAARLHLRRTLGARWTLLGQGGWQRLNDNRPGYSYSRGVFSLGLEVRP
jgi:hypothetical protein